MSQITSRMSPTSHDHKDHSVHFGANKYYSTYHLEIFVIDLFNTLKVSEVYVFMITLGIFSSLVQKVQFKFELTIRRYLRKNKNVASPF